MHFYFFNVFEHLDSVENLIQLLQCCVCNRYTGTLKENISNVWISKCAAWSSRKPYTTKYSRFKNSFMIQISTHICCFVEIIMNKKIEDGNQILNEYHDKIFLTMLYQKGYHPNYGNFR